MSESERLVQLRERNRRHAANCRMRKRLALELAQEQVAKLEEENEPLKEAVRYSISVFALTKCGTTVEYWSESMSE